MTLLRQVLITRWADTVAKLSEIVSDCQCAISENTSASPVFLQSLDRKSSLKKVTVSKWAVLKIPENHSVKYWLVIGIPPRIHIPLSVLASLIPNDIIPVNGQQQKTIPIPIH